MKKDNKAGDKDTFQTWAALPKRIQEALKQHRENALSLEEFTASVMVGNCPKCGGVKVSDCEEVKGIEDNTIGTCFNCGYLWCLECGRELKEKILCEHWEICEQCPNFNEDEGGCDIPPIACEKVSGITDSEVRKDIFNEWTIINAKENDPKLS